MGVKRSTKNGRQVYAKTISIPASMQEDLTVLGQAVGRTASGYAAHILRQQLPLHKELLESDKPKLHDKELV